MGYVANIGLSSVVDSTVTGCSGVMLGYAAGPPGAIVGGIAGATLGFLFSPIWFLFNYTTRQQVCMTKASQTDFSKVVGKIDLMSNEELSKLFNNVVYLYEQQVNRNSSYSSCKLIKKLKSLSHILHKRELVKEYLLKKQGGVFYNDGKRLFRIFHSQLNELLQQGGAVLSKRKHRNFAGNAWSTNWKCPLANGKYLEQTGDKTLNHLVPFRGGELDIPPNLKTNVAEPVLVTYKNTAGQQLRAVVDRGNLKEIMEHANAQDKSKYFVTLGDEHLGYTEVDFNVLEDTSSATKFLEQQGMFQILGDKISTVFSQVCDQVVSFFSSKLEEVNRVTVVPSAPPAYMSNAAS